MKPRRMKPQRMKPRRMNPGAEARAEHDARLMTEVLRSGGDRLVTLRRFLDRATDEELRGLRRAAEDASARRELAAR